MTEVDIFKQSYLQGRIVYIQGPSGTRKVRMAYQFLSSCHVQDREIATLTASEFLKNFESRIADFLIRGLRVFVVTQVHLVPAAKHSAFVKVMTYARRLFFSCGIRVILVSSRDCSLYKKVHAQVPTMRIRVKGCHRDNADERVHWALELACRVAQKRVTQLSEPVANFLENAGEEFQDDGLLQTLICAVRNSTNGVLKLDDFIKSDNPKPPSPDEPATCCN